MNEKEWIEFMEEKGFHFTESQKLKASVNYPERKPAYSNQTTPECFGRYKNGSPCFMCCMKSSCMVRQEEDTKP
jgi:hypothetical protein